MKEYGKCPVCETRIIIGKKCSTCGYIESLDYSLYMTLGLIDEEKSTVGKYKEWKKRNDEDKERTHQEEIEALQKRIEKMARQLEKQGQEAEKKAETEREAERIRKETEERKQELARQEEKRKAEAERVRQRAETKKVKPKKKISKVPLVVICAAVLVCVGIGLLLNFGGKEENSAKKISASSEVGDTIVFGSYEQDGDESSTEDIEWTVLAKEKGKLLVISKYILDYQPYNEENTEVTWETCTLRSWLNEDFLNNAFSSEEQSQIEETEGLNGENPFYEDVDGGKDTTDKIFLLSVAEVNNYFDSVDERECKATQYAKDQGVYVGDTTGNSFWWLRSAGFSGGLAAFVNLIGIDDSYGYSVNSVITGVRPALWLDPES